jgi:large subunit ribosomal protein L5
MATGTQKKAAGDKGAKATKATPKAKKSAPAGIPRLRQRYQDDVIGSLMKEFSYKNVSQVPRLEKVTINFGLGEAVANPNVIKTSLEELTLIAGQKPVATRAKKAIANFKLRAGLPIGVMVTLRRERMWEFLDRLMNVAMPRIRDFKGMSPKAFDGRGNYCAAIKEQTIFPEIPYEKVDKARGMGIVIGTTATTDAEAKSLLKQLGMPFRA